MDLRAWGGELVTPLWTPQGQYLRQAELESDPEDYVCSRYFKDVTSCEQPCVKGLGTVDSSHTPGPVDPPTLWWTWMVVTLPHGELIPTRACQAALLDNSTESCVHHPALSSDYTKPLALETVWLLTGVTRW